MPEISSIETSPAKTDSVVSTLVHEAYNGINFIADHPKESFYTAGALTLGAAAIYFSRGRVLPELLGASERGVLAAESASVKAVSAQKQTAAAFDFTSADIYVSFKNDGTLHGSIAGDTESLARFYAKFPILQHELPRKLPETIPHTGFLSQRDMTSGLLKKYPILRHETSISTETPFLSKLGTEPGSGGSSFAAPTIHRTESGIGGTSFATPSEQTLKAVVGSLKKKSQALQKQ